MEPCLEAKLGEIELGSSSEKLSSDVALSGMIDVLNHVALPSEEDKSNTRPITRNIQTDPKFNMNLREGDSMTYMLSSKFPIHKLSNIVD